jgi:protein Tex
MLPSGRTTPAQVVVSKAGASVYSASGAGREGIPRPRRLAPGRRLPRAATAGPARGTREDRSESIGLGQYQHDVDQRRLSKSLEAVVEEAVNAVGVDIDTASASLWCLSPG